MSYIHRAGQAREGIRFLDLDFWCVYLGCVWVSAREKSMGEWRNITEFPDSWARWALLFAHLSCPIITPWKHLSLTHTQTKHCSFQLLCFCDPSSSSLLLLLLCLHVYCTVNGTFHSMECVHKSRFLMRTDPHKNICRRISVAWAEADSIRAIGLACACAWFRFCLHFRMFIDFLCTAKLIAIYFIFHRK